MILYKLQNTLNNTNKDLDTISQYETTDYFANFPVDLGCEVGGAINTDIQIHRYMLKLNTFNYQMEFYFVSTSDKNIDYLYPIYIKVLDILAIKNNDYGIESKSTVLYCLKGINDYLGAIKHKVYNNRGFFHPALLSNAYEGLTNKVNMGKEYFRDNFDALNSFDMGGSIASKDIIYEILNNNKLIDMYSVVSSADKNIQVFNEHLDMIVNNATHLWADSQYNNKQYNPNDYKNFSNTLVETLGPKLPNDLKSNTLVKACLLKDRLSIRELSNILLENINIVDTNPIIHPSVLDKENTFVANENSQLYSTMYRVVAEYEQGNTFSNFLPFRWDLYNVYENVIQTPSSMINVQFKCSSKLQLYLNLQLVRIEKEFCDELYFLNKRYILERMKDEVTNILEFLLNSDKIPSIKDGELEIYYRLNFNELLVTVKYTDIKNNPRKINFVLDTLLISLINQHLA